MPIKALQIETFLKRMTAFSKWAGGSERKSPEDIEEVCLSVTAVPADTEKGGCAVIPQWLPTSARW